MDLIAAKAKKANREYLLDAVRKSLSFLAVIIPVTKVLHDKFDEGLYTVKELEAMTAFVDALALLARNSTDLYDVLKKEEQN